MKNKTIGWLIVISFIVRGILACITELNNDEVYYWTYAKKLQWNYFDHPPGVAVMLKICTFNLHFQQEFFLRLGSIICAAASTWLVYLIGKKIKNEMAGTIAAVLFTASPYCSIIAGWLVIPDAPQLVFWLASILLMLKIIDPNVRRRKLQQRFVLLGLSIGCCMLCKIHGVFLWLGFLSYIIFYQRKLLRYSFLFYSVFISAVVVSPVMFWNLSNDFISYRYHSSRVSFFSSIQPDSFFRELAGEALYNNPIIFVVLILALWAIARKQLFIPLPSQRLLLLLSLPMIALVVFMSVFRDTLPHWTGPAYTTLIPLTAAYLFARRAGSAQNELPAVAKWALSLTIVLLFAATIVIKWLPCAIGSREWQQMGDGDPTLDMTGFRKMGSQFDSLYKKDIATGSMNSGACIISDCWFPAAHLDYYAAAPNGIPFMAIGNINAIHHYAWLNKIRPSLHPGDDAYFITVSNYFHPVPETLQKRFGKVLTPAVITQYRGGIAVRNFFIYRLIGCKENFPADGIIN